MSKEQVNEADQENRDRWEAHRTGKWLESSEEALFRKVEAAKDQFPIYTEFHTENMSNSTRPFSDLKLTPPTISQDSLDLQDIIKSSEEVKVTTYEGQKDFKNPPIEVTGEFIERLKEGIKFDQNKTRVDLLPSVALEEIGKALTFGASKYNSWNWSKGLSYSRLLGSTLRHLFAYMRGEDKDKESGLSHLSHAGCCIMFLLWYEKFRPDLDDRNIDPDCRELK